LLKIPLDFLKNDFIFCLSVRISSTLLGFSTCPKLVFEPRYRNRTASKLASWG